MRERRIAIALLALGACRTRPLDAALDGSAPPPDAAALDAATDAARDPMCRTHSRVAVPLSVLELVDAEPPTIGRVIRVRADVPLTFCDRLADFSGTESGGAGPLVEEVTAHLWRASHACADVPTTPWVFAFRPFGDAATTGGTFIVRDGATGGSASLTLSVAPPDGTCAAPPATGCTLDCHCLPSTAATRCLPNPFPGSGFICQTPCNRDADCPDGFACSTLQSQERICFPGAPQVIPPALAETACNCDSDCATSQVCAIGLGEDAPARCLTPCVEDRDCVTGSCVLGRCQF